ncbi:guanine deaminase [Whalleya microplaca]|nr:guanine deaminase [Whalleya microplaca]
MGVINQPTSVADPILTRLVKEDKVRWFRKPNLRFLYFLLLPTCMGIELTSGFDSQMINALQIVPSWITYFGDPQGSLKGIIAAAYSLGAIASLPFIGVVNDKCGRRYSILGGSIIMVIGALIQGLSVNAGMYIVARLILGFGIPTCIVSASSLIGELSYPKERPVLTSLFNVSYFVGQIVAAAICFGTNNIASNMAWKIPSWLQMCPSLLQIAFVMFLPESPRFLITKDRTEEAYEILAKYHAEDDHDSEFVKAEFAQIKATISIELENSKRSWADLFVTSGMRRRMLISSMLGLFTQWSGNTLISYYLGDLLAMIGKNDSVFKQQINVANSCWQLVCGTAVAFLVTKFKRRHMYLACTCSLLVVYVCWTVSMERAIAGNDSGNPNNAANVATIFFIFAYSPCYNIGYNALTYTYLVELWPYAERSRGIAFFQLFGRLAGFFTTFVNPIGLANVSWRYLISYCCFLTFEIAFVYFMFPETFGRTLEELAFLFEDKALADEAVHAVEKVVGHVGDDAAPGTNIETMGSSHIFHGTFVHSLNASKLEIIENGILLVGTVGEILDLRERGNLSEYLSENGFVDEGVQVEIHELKKGEFLIPGFVDTHNHAPQWGQRGLGQSMHILDWLEKVTFPNEARFRDPEHAKRIYSDCVDGFLRQGITTASYYGSLHAEATKILANLCFEKGQRAFVGKCNMNRNSPDYYRDDTVESSLQDTRDCLAHVRALDPERALLDYVLTPRFAISCENSLLTGLGKLAADNPDLPIQTHFNEAEQEMAFTKTLFPEFDNEADLYAHFGLLTEHSILAHCCYMTNYELNRLKELNCGVAHCPVSNMTVGGGFMAAPIREFLTRGIKVGLGTDSGGGFSSSILDAMRQALVASNAREVISDGKDKGLTIAELFYLATLGGARVCCLENKIGNFEIKKDFDALVISTQGTQPGVMTMIEENESVQTTFEKFIMTGDDRNIKEVYVRGRSVKPKP